MVVGQHGPVVRDKKTRTVGDKRVCRLQAHIWQGGPRIVLMLAVLSMLPAHPSGMSSNVPYGSHSMGPGGSGGGVGGEGMERFQPRNPYSPDARGRVPPNFAHSQSGDTSSFISQVSPRTRERGRKGE